jgi:hypothetical protein
VAFDPLGFEEEPVRLEGCKHLGVSIRRRFHGCSRRLYTLSLQYLSSTEMIRTSFVRVENGFGCCLPIFGSTPVTSIHPRASSVDVFPLPFPYDDGQRADICNLREGGNTTKVRDFWHGHLRMGYGLFLVGLGAHGARAFPFLHAVCHFIS